MNTINLKHLGGNAEGGSKHEQGQTHMTNFCIQPGIKVVNFVENQSVTSKNKQNYFLKLN